MQLVRFTPAMLLPLALLAACGASSPTSTEPSAPTSGWLTLQLSSPSTNDGAVQFAISGPAIDSVSIIGYDGFAATDHGTVNLVVTGQIGNGDIARIHVADLTATSQYHATVAAAAARVTYALATLDGYRAVLVR